MQNATQNTTETKITVTEVSRATYTNSKPWDSTLESLIDGGWELDSEDIDALNEGTIVALYSPNGMRKIYIKKAE